MNYFLQETVNSRSLNIFPERIYEKYEKGPNNNKFKRKLFFVEFPIPSSKNKNMPSWQGWFSESWMTV